MQGHAGGEPDMQRGTHHISASHTAFVVTSCAPERVDLVVVAALRLWGMATLTGGL